MIASDLLVIIEAEAAREGRSVEQWLDWTLRLHLFGHQITLVGAPPAQPRTPRPMRAPISSRQRTATFLRSNGACHHCGSQLDPLGTWEIDHLVPVCKGGDNDAANLVASCRACNGRKGAKVA